MRRRTLNDSAGGVKSPKTKSSLLVTANSFARNTDTTRTTVVITMHREFWTCCLCSYLLICVLLCAHFSPSATLELSGYVHHNYYNLDTRAAVSPTDANIYLLGYTETSTQVDAFYARFSPIDGSLIDTQKFGGTASLSSSTYWEDYPYDITFHNGDIIVVGQGSSATAQRRSTIWRFAPSYGSMTWGFMLDRRKYIEPILLPSSNLLKPQKTPKQRKLLS